MLLYGIYLIVSRPEGYRQLGIRLAFTIYGNLPRKSNSRIPTWQGGKFRLIKSKQALAYVDSFMEQVPPEVCIDLCGACSISLYIHYEGLLSDLSDELFADLCEKAGIIRNDNYFRSKHLEWRYAPDVPRVEAVIEEIPDYPADWLPNYQKKDQTCQKQRPRSVDRSRKKWSQWAKDQGLA